MRLAHLLSLCCLLGASALRLLHAQTAPVSDHHVVFYTEPNYRGESLVVEAGAAVENLDTLARANRAPWSGIISSIRVSGDAQAVVFSAPHHRGERLDITHSIPDLHAIPRGRSTWDRAITSLSVAGPTAPPPTVIPTPPPAPPPSSVIIVSPPPPPPSRPHLDRRTAELMVQRAYREVLDRPADPEGLRTYLNRLLREGWSERRMIEHLQRSDEARAVKADDAIAKAYREVLGREPDASGLATYKARWKEGWTQGRIREDLRRSHEGRDHQIRTIITKVYRDLLRREPDPEGLATYERLMRERGYSERDIRSAIMNGDEYRQLQRSKQKTPRP